MSDVLIDVALHPLLVGEANDEAGLASTLWIALEPGFAGPAILTMLNDGAAAVEVFACGELRSLHDSIGAIDSGAGSSPLVAPDLAGVFESLLPASRAGARVLVGALPNVRPLATFVSRAVSASRKTGRPIDRVCVACAGIGSAVAGDAAWASGVLCRVLLEELDGAPRLSDAAGIAVALTGSYGSALAALASGGRAAAREDILGRQTVAAELQVAAQSDVVGVVGELAVDGGRLLVSIAVDTPAR